MSFLYAAWAGASFLLLGLTVLVLILPVPSLALRRRMTRHAARVALWCCGIRVALLHPEHLPAGPCVVVANHSSYLDGVVLFAALPPTFGFVIKREMRGVPIAGLLLRRIGSHFVDRTRAERSARDTLRLLKHARDGGAMAFFPEGTFRPERGLQRFRSRRFHVARTHRCPRAGGDPWHAHGIAARSSGSRGPAASTWNSQPPLATGQHACDHIGPVMRVRARDTRRTTSRISRRWLGCP